MTGGVEGSAIEFFQTANLGWDGLHQTNPVLPGIIGDLI